MPYTDEDIALAEQRFASQGQLIADDLAAKDVNLAPDSEMAAVIAYLQRLGRGPQPVAAVPAETAPGEVGGIRHVPGVLRRSEHSGLASGRPADLRRRSSSACWPTSFSACATAGKIDEMASLPLVAEETVESRDRDDAGRSGGPSR